MSDQIPAEPNNIQGSLEIPDDILMDILEDQDGEPKIRPTDLNNSIESLFSSQVIVDAQRLSKDLVLVLKSDNAIEIYGTKTQVL